MLSIIAENSAGQTVDLTGNSAYILARADGLTPPTANINLAPLATKDGSIYNSSFANNRNVVLTIYPQNTLQSARLDLYDVFKVKRWVKLYLTTSQRATYTEGYVESIEGSLFDNPQQLQISVICPDPYLLAVDAGQTLLDEGSTTTVTNDSDDTVGGVVTLTFSAAETEVTLTNDTTGESFGLAYDFEAGDSVEIGSLRGAKHVTLTRDGAEVNLLNYMSAGSEWISFEPGDNSVTLSGSGVTGVAVIRPIYEGV